MMKVPQQSLVTAQTGFSKMSARCTPARIDNSNCDPECNTMQHGFDGGSCCGISREDYACLPWICQDRKDTAFLSGKTCSQMTLEECKETETSWSSPDQKTFDACPVTCQTCNSSDQNVLVSWPYALTIGDGTRGNEKTVVPLMPASFHRVFREQQVAQYEAEQGEVPNRTELYDELLSTLPSFACPECAATTKGSNAYRSIPFTVSGDPPQNMFKQLDNNKPRMRFLSRPNLVLYGILLSQERVQERSCSVEGNTLLAQFSYLGSLCHGKPSTEPFGKDPTFVQGKSVYSEREAVPHNGVPSGFTFDQGDPSGLTTDYPVFFDVDLNRSQAKKLMAIVVEGGYFDGGTSSAKAAMLLMNLELGSIAEITIESKRQSAGGISFEVSIALIDLYPYSFADPSDLVRLICEVLAAIAIGTMCSIEVWELHRTGIRQYVSPANLVDLLSYALVCAVLVNWSQYTLLTYRFSREDRNQYNVYANVMATNRILQVNSVMPKLQQQFSTMEEIMAKLAGYDQLVAVALTAMVIQLLKNLHFHPSIGILSRTLQNASLNLLVLLALQTAIIALYSIQGMLLLGQETDEFASLPYAVKSLVLFLCGELPQVPDSAPVQIFFWTYMLISVFIMLNAVLSVIMIAYSEIADEQAGSVPDPLRFALANRFRQRKFLSPAALLHLMDTATDHKCADHTLNSDWFSGMVYILETAERKVRSTHINVLIDRSIRRRPDCRAC